MHSKTAMLDESAGKLLKKAADCFDLAETQSHVADRQHEIASQQHCSADELQVSADKLEALGHALEADAAEIQGNSQVVAEGSVPTAPTLTSQANVGPPPETAPAPSAPGSLISRYARAKLKSAGVCATLESKYALDTFGPLTDTILLRLTIWPTLRPSRCTSPIEP